MSGSSDDSTSRYLRTELLERIAHELRGPAGVTLGALDELEHALGPEQAEQNRLLFAMARRGAKRVLRTAERLTRTALLESGPLQVGRSSLDLRTVLRQAVRDAELVEGRSSVQVKLTLPEEPALVAGDGAWWTVAFGELVSQAIRCARRDVDVTMTANDHVVVTVRDDRTAIIDASPHRFVQLRDRRDSALGWPLVWDVANAHGARIESEPLQDANGATVGLCISVELVASAQQFASAGE
jgi:signal transduction histidine kinase